MKKNISKICLLVSLVISNLFYITAQDFNSIKRIEEIRKDKAKVFLQNIGKESSYLVDGELVEVQYLDKRGNPVFYKVYNSDASRLTNINSVKVNGSLGLKLTGKNVNVAVWDGGSVLQSHQELEGRTSGGDAPANLSNHATHVTGTIIASGVNPSSEGMATQGVVKYFDFNQDNSEMIKAAEDGVIISNHSYGEVLGWNYNGSSWNWFGDNEISEIEDYRFGNYNSNSALWDDIAHSNPYYLVVKSSGNDRSDVGSGSGAPADGPFDTIGPKGCSKNILTVGAVQKASNFNDPLNINITSFSSWGPTDDGRIKPDIVGVGQGIISSSSAGEDQYASLSGTSMSAPNVTGGLVLLQELYYDITTNYMLSASLKGLVIHTAKQTGENIGPDYRFGWGLFNAASAAELLLKFNDNNRLIESTISDETEFKTYTIQADSGDLVTSTLSWTDLPGSTVNSDTLDPIDLRIVNDLDSRLYFNGEEVGLPYIMNPETKSQSKGDNFRDNVEKIHFVAQESGLYELKISHKGLENAANQNYSLILSTENVESKLNTMILSAQNNDWNDISNWKNFDESSADHLPNKNTIVLVDNNQSSSIILNEDIEVFSLSNLNNSGLELDLNGHAISVNNLNIDNEDLIIKNGVLNFNSNYDNSLVEVSDENSFQNLVINVDKGSGKSVTMLGTLKFNKINVNAGLLKFNQSEVETDTLLFSENASLFSLDSKLKVNSDFNSETDSLNFDSSNILFTSDNIQIDANIANENGVVEFSGNNIKYTGDLTSSNVFISGDIFVDGNLSIDDLEIYDSSNLDFSANSNLKINSDFYLTDSLDNQNGVKIESFGGKSFIESDSKNKLCFTNLNVIDVDKLGSTKFVLEGNSSVTNSQGWILDNCEDILDAKFYHEFSCANGVTKFYNFSDGQDFKSFLWEFITNDDVITSEEENPEIVFSEMGEVEVYLTVITENDTSSIQSKIEVIQSDISKPSIEYNNGMLSSTRFSDNYQWYNNGIPIENSNSPSISIGEMSGEFFVEIYNDRCLMRSEVFETLVNSNKEELEQNLKLFPNPSNGIIKLQSELDFEIVGVYDLNGSLINHNVLNLSNSSKEINMLDQRGIFLVIMQIQDTRIVRKIVVMD